MLKELYILSLIPVVASYIFTGLSIVAGRFNTAESAESAENPQNTCIGYADGHCDTVTAAINAGVGLYRNNLHIDFERLAAFDSPIQVFAIWCDGEYLDNAFEYANSAIDFFEREIQAHSDIIELALSYDDIERISRENKISAILALEGAEPLCGRLENLEYFYNRGVRLITLTWNRENELGYGVSTVSRDGLKPFGIDCVKKMNELGVIIDVSHLNEEGFWDVHNISEKAYVASHSNAFAVAGHKRNLNDAQIKAIIEKGGHIGLNLYPYFLTGAEKARISDILSHIEYFVKLGAADNLGLGCDFDGVDVLPDEISGISSINKLNEKITEKFGETVSRKIISENFMSFLKRVF